MTGRDQRLRVACVGALALLTTYVGQHSAYADSSPTGRLTVVSQTPGSARLLVTAVGLPRTASVDPSSAHVAINGRPAAATATLAGSTTSVAVARRTVLVFDASGSMAGAGIAGARRAALAFAASVPADVKVGLVVFANRPRVALEPTLSRSALADAVSRLAARGETALYDGVDLGLKTLGPTGERSLVVLSDGADTRSHASLPGVTSRLQQSGVRMDAVALHTPDAASMSLQHMTAAAGGRVTAAASAASLASAFSAAARTFASQVVVDVTVPDSLRGRTVSLDVTMSTSAGTVHASNTLLVTGAAVTSTAGPTEPPSPAPHHGAPASLLVLAFAGIFVPVLTLLIALQNRRSPESRTKRVLHRYTLAQAPAGADNAGSTGIARLTGGLMNVADRIASSPTRRAKLLLRLSRADVTLTPGEWIAVQSLVAFVSGVFGMLVLGSLPLGLILAALGFAASNLWLTLKGHRRLRAFDEHLPSALQLVASSLRSGFSLAQALDGVVREGIEPIAGELNRALTEARLGMPIEDALDGIGDRMASNDFRWVVMAIRIQREVGGNLAEILLNTAGVMRERARLRRQVKALSAEGRLSAYVLLGLPVLMATYMFTLRRAYIRPLYTTGLGIGMLVLAVFLVVMGTLWMRKVVTVEV